VDYFNKMAKLAFATVFNIHTCRTKLTKRQKFKKQNDFKQANERLCWKKYNCVRQMELHTFVRYIFISDLLT